MAHCLTALNFYIDVGVDEVINTVPLNRFAKPIYAVDNDETTTSIPKPVRENKATEGPTKSFEKTPQVSTKAEAAAFSLAAGANNLNALREVIEKFDLCSLKKTATNTVFSAGNACAKLMLIGEAPGAEEDRQGLPFVGASGQLLDTMLASIGLDRKSVYIANLICWRPPGNRKPTSEEITTCLPFIRRHIELVRPQILVFVGGTSASALLENKDGITRIRGRWSNYTPKVTSPNSDEKLIPAMPIFHPAYLLRQPALKRLAWADLLQIKARIKSLG